MILPSWDEKSARLTYEGERRDTLLISVQCREGWAKTWVYELNRGAVRKPSGGNVREFQENLGRFGKLFG